jgi:MoaA/NifB/PqqE/SkfB family radical SAM enzyme
MNTDNKNQSKCIKPFKWFEILSNGDVFLCCPRWLPKSIGNINRQSISEIWNSKKAQKIRKTILDNSYKYCKEELCSDLQHRKFSFSSSKQDLPLTSSGPKIINCCFDKSCNLACPSCRKDRYVAIGKEREKIDRIFSKITLQAGKEIECLRISGSGDPLASPASFLWLKNLKLQDFPKLKRIYLHTNGLVFTPKTWKILSGINHLIKSVEVSIDAGTKETYAINRKGGDFSILLKNLDFIKSLRVKKKLIYTLTSFVVQANNYQEMEKFIKLGKRYRFDHIYFSQLVNWGTFSKKEYKMRAIHLSNHPQHYDFVRTLSKISGDKKVGLGNLSYLINP